MYEWDVCAVLSAPGQHILTLARLSWWSHKQRKLPHEPLTHLTARNVLPNGWPAWPSSMLAQHVTPGCLEEQIPGFKSCFGGEELRRAQASMCATLVGGTISAWRTDLPPSLVQFSTLDKKSNTNRPAPQAHSDGVAPNLVSPRHSITTISQEPQQQAILELEQMCRMFTADMAKLDVEGILEALKAQEHPAATATGTTTISSKPSTPSKPQESGSSSAPATPPSTQPGTAHGSTPAPSPAVVSAAYEAVYGLGLTRQDLASRCVPGTPQQLTQLQKACENYNTAVKLRPGSHSALYNWGVALSDLARSIRHADPNSARLCLEAAATRYAQALATNPDSPQALNNWGLVLQELSGLARSKQERDSLLRQACARFRQAIHLRPDFDRACYNLGTICYAAACTLQGELALQPQITTGAPPPAAAAAALMSATGIASFPEGHSGASGSAAGSSGGWSSDRGPGTAAEHFHRQQQGEAQALALANLQQDAEAQRNAREIEVCNLFACAAQYICLAHTLQQHKDIYRKSLSMVRRLLPLPFLRAGYLMTPVPSTRGTPEEAWRQDWFVLDARSLRSATSMEGSLSSAHNPVMPQPNHVASDSTNAIVIPLHNIAHVTRCRDSTLPRGEGFAVIMKGAQLESGMTICLVAEDEQSADTWTDVLLLAAHVVQSRSTEALWEALVPSPSQANHHGQLAGHSS